MRRLFRGVPFAAATALGLLVLLSATVVHSASAVTYDSILSPLPPNVPSLGYQANQTAEFGDDVQLVGANQFLSAVTVTMSDWAKKSDYPSVGTASNWTHPITLNVYNVDASGANPALGSLITSVTQTATIPWRPESDPTCPDTGMGAGFAWRAGDTNCYNGFAFNLTFSFAHAISVPSRVIVSIAYNTNTWGANPIGLPGPYESLNVGLNNVPPQTTVGTDSEPDAVFWNTMTPTNYTDGGLGGIGTFRRDTAWAPYVPMLQISSEAGCTTTCYVNSTTGNDSFTGADAANAKQTIQAGVDAVSSGGTVIVAAGTNNVTQVHIAKPLTLQGAGLATTTIDGGASVLGPSAYGMIYVDSVTGGGVTIKGFTMQNAGAPSDDPEPMLIVVAGNAASAPIDVEDNHFIGVGGDSFDIGFWQYSGDGKVTLKNNEFNGMWQGVLLERPRGGASVTGNNFHNLVTSFDGSTLYEAEGIFAFSYSGDNISAALDISSNSFTGFSGDSVIVGGGYTAHTPAVFSNVTITNNTTNAIGAGSERRHVGIGLFNVDGTGATGGAPGAVISGNTLTGSSTSNDSIGIWLRGPSDGVQIKNNFVNGVNAGIKSEDYLANGNFTANAVIFDNDLSGNAKAVSNGSASVGVNASGNWWGSNVGATVVAATAGAVDVTPFLDSGTDGSATVGFQGTHNVLNVTAALAQTGATGRLDEAVALVNASGQINVLAGTYPESATINKTVDIRGAKFGVAGTAGRTFADATESTFDGQIGVQAANVKFDGFSIKRHVSTNSTAFGIHVKTAGTGSSIKNNIFSAILSDFTNGNQAHAVGIYLENGPDNVTITRNLFDGIHGWASSQAILVGDSLASDPSTGIDIESNTIKNITSDGKGAYGVQANNGASTAPAATGYSDLTIKSNTLDTLTGVWVHAIAFEGPSTVADVQLNTVTNLVSSPSSGTDRIAVFFENDAPFVSALVSNNSLAVGNDRYGVINATASSLDATCNWWGDAGGPNSTSGSDTVGTMTVAPWRTTASLAGTCASIALGSAAADANGNEGSLLSTSGSFTGSVAAITANNLIGTFTPNPGAGTWTWSYTPTDQFSATAITVTATGSNGSTATDQFSTSAANVKPTATFNAPASALYSSAFSISLTSPSDVSSADTTAGFTYDFDCGSGYTGTPTSTASRGCTAPASPGTVTVKGKIFDKDGGNTEYTKSVQVTQPSISLLPASKNYGSVVVNSTSAATAFTVKNTGTAPLAISGVALTGTNATQFAITTNGCNAATLAPNATCTINVVFKPTTSGAKTASLEVTSNDPNAHVASAALSGSGALASPGTVTIILDARPDGAQAFVFQASGGLGSFSLTDNNTGHNQKSFTVAAGDYDFIVTSVTKWSLVGLTCNVTPTYNSGGHVAVHVNSGQNVSCTFTESRRLPDSSISLTQNGTYKGVGIYADDVVPGQTASQTVGRGQTKSFWVHLDNKGLNSDTYRVVSTFSGSTSFAVTFWANGINVTSSVNDGTYRVTLAAAGRQLMEIRVTASTTTAAGAIRNINLMQQSTTASAARDFVRAHVSRP